MTGSIQEIVNLHNLNFLNLKNNGLSGPIPSTIFNISKLEIIALDRNRLSGPIPSTIGLAVNLKKLYLWENELNGIIPDSISNASQLTTLELELNSFSGPIPTTIGNLRNLQDLTLFSNQLTVESSTQDLNFLSSLTNCKSLRRISLSNNPLSSTLPVSIGNLSTTLTEFWAHDCKIKGSIPQEVGNLRNLTTLSLEDNELTGSVPTAIGKMRMLQVLHLDGNKLQGSIPNEVCHLRNLGDLYLSGNNLSGPIPACLGDINSLRILYLNSNNFTSRIPASLWSLKDLLRLNLSTNSFSGHLPQDIGNLKVVSEIDLSGNELSGEIPSSIGGLQSLINFSIAQNQLQGPIPESFGNLVNLEILDLSSNNLSGSIPKSIEKLRYLKGMNVSFNRLKGEIPTGGSFANLSVGSFLGNSELCGAPQFQVPPCKASSLKGSKRRSVLKPIYILPAIASTILVLALIFLLFRCQKRKSKRSDKEDMPALSTWRRISYQELEHATNGFDESSLLGEEDSTTQTNTLATIGYMAPEYGSEGIVSTRGDMYSFGILMMETFTRKKPTDNMFDERLSLQYWIKDALPHSVTEIADTNLLGEENLSAKKECILSILQVAVDCTVEMPENRLDIANVLGALKNIKTKFEKSLART
ncbi:hypothetical protein LWI29_033127 [Acer saccharum]|uniref:Protein kinase domain-containing protein n=1 Tax=Acer saccharum TaxID=4024 RepID=A0AA39RTE7_ACESA|nr:hypothetical protein LWI29_033127 [Acer saccharum]